MGSSIVRMCSWRSMLILSIMAARVVDFPLPVGPVTRMSPRGLSQSCSTTGGRFRVLKSLDFKRDETKHGADCAALGEHVGAKPAQILDPERKIYFPFFFELVLLTVGHHAVCESFGVRGIQDLLVDGAQLSVHTDLGRDSRRQMQVRCSCLYGFLEHFGQSAHCFLSN